MTANSTPESFGAVLAEMRCPLVSTREIPHDVVERMFRNIADRLQSAHARELAEQQATIEALRGGLQMERTAIRYAAEQGVADEARADAAMGLVAKWREEAAPSAGMRQEHDADSAYDAALESCANELEQALAGGERKDG